MGARIAMRRLAKMNRSSFLLGDWTSPSELLPASGGCQRPERDMSVRAGFVNGMAGMRSMPVMGMISDLCWARTGWYGMNQTPSPARRLLRT